MKPGFLLLSQYSVPDIDLTIERHIPVTDSKRFQIRADAFNFTNTPSFAAPDDNPFSNGGLITQSSSGSWNGYGIVPRYNFSHIVQPSLKSSF